MLMTCHYPDLGSASDWLNQFSHAAGPISARQQYGISARVSQTSFGGETAKCYLFFPSRAKEAKKKERTPDLRLGKPVERLQMSAVFSG